MPGTTPSYSPVNLITPSAGVGEEQRLRSARERAATFAVEIQKKYAIAAACLVFALVGAPVALRFQRGGVGLVLGVSVAVFTVYYIGLIGGEELGNRLMVSPFFAMWTPNLVFTIAGLVGVWRIRKPGNSPHGGDWSDLWPWASGLTARRPVPRLETSPP
jgi:lipopolysaccharide export system permease protein